MKKELIEKIMKDLPAGATTWEIEESLKKNLPDFQRIDKERLRKICMNSESSFDSDVDEYNSTLPPVLNPLPKEMPEWFAPHMTRVELWDQVVSYYGTPEPKPPLPTVEELRDKMYRWVGSVDLDECEILAQNLHEKYSLPTREWWQDCEKFMYKGRAYEKYSHEVFPDGRTVLHSELAGHNLIYCTPYTPPSAQEIIAKHNLSEEEVRAIREGKCT